MRRLPRAAAVLAAAITLAGAGGAAPAAAAPDRLTERASYRNPVSRAFADTYADPAVVRGHDGWWYAYGTTDPLREGEQDRHLVPISRSRDLVDWRYVGDAFVEATVPTWADRSRGAAVWAPDVRYVDGEWRMYYVITQTAVGPAGNTNDNAIGMATAPGPAGPWTDSGAPVVGPRPGASGNADDFLWTFDPSVVSHPDGSQWIFYGSYYGGVYVARLSKDGRTTVSGATMVAIDNKFEGAYPVRHGGYWYLFLSTANCCAGPTTGYSVQVGRSRSIEGPYLDAQGVRLTESRAGGTPAIVQNGNRWIGAGHNAVVTDLAGQDWAVYHALDRSDPYLTGTDGINERPMLLDRLDWVDGWPVLRAGRGPSETEQSGPATGGRWVTAFDSGLPAGWGSTGSWTGRSDSTSGGHLRSRAAGTVTSGKIGGSVRVEAHLRSAGAAYGLTARVGASTVQALVDPEAGTLRLQQRRSGRVLGTTTRALPTGFDARDWHAFVLQVRGGHVSAEVTHARLHDPLVGASLRVRGASTVRDAGAVARGAGVAVDNLSVLPVAPPVTRLAPDRVPDRLDAAASDEFGGAGLAADWSWVRRDEAATVDSGVLRWPTQAADLTGTGNDAGVLLRSPVAGGSSSSTSWTVETKVSIDLGVDQVRNFSQAGLIAYVNDDLFTRFSHVAIFNTRQTEFGLEMPYAGRLSYGGTIVGPPAATTWLRLTHRLDPRNGEHELRAWSSRDGRSWVKGGVWTLPAEAELRVGLVSHGGAGPTAEFDYFRLYR